MQVMMALITKVLSAKSTNKRTLQTLAGKLVWAARLIRLGRSHTRRLFTFISTLDHPSQRTTLNDDTRRDLTWWVEFAPYFNGVYPISPPTDFAPLSIDASSKAGGGFYMGEGFTVFWEDWPETASLHINFKEVLVLEPAVHLWGHLWTQKTIYVHSDNQAAVGIINKGYTRNEKVMTSLRRVAWLAANHNFELRAVYYPGERNVLADALSRLPTLPAVRTLNNLLGPYFLQNCIKWRTDS